ncbi:EF_hand domain-containing protein [Hexamita inflata]|uniref:EF hand domain-containing protein n=1 Tax=Hexamita inflata TaxID=28002 RepID=A0AA86TTV0_9EUKA|nr:EF hand domain-containing protein [Hexamita inflata]
MLSTADTITYRYVFNELDYQQKGSLSLQQLQQALQSLDIALNQDQLNRILRTIDRNNDNQIQFNEFCQLLYICNYADPTDPIQVLFFAADENFNGKVDKQELYTLFKKLNITVNTVDVDRLFKKFGQEELTYIQFKELINKLK